MGRLLTVYLPRCVSGSAPVQRRVAGNGPRSSGHEGLIACIIRHAADVGTSPLGLYVALRQPLRPVRALS